MKTILNRLFEYKALTKAEAKDIINRIASAEFNNSHIAAFLSVYLMRSITVEELQGFREALLDLCLRVDFDGVETIDLCGTGGDAKDTFNISTLSTFVVAGAGIKVAKHGNYGVSSVSGSSNVMEKLGYKFTNNIGELKRQMDACNVCFLHAPLFHPAMKQVGPVRKEMGVKTFFNMLGPLVNPAFPKYQLIGVFNLELLRLYNYLLQDTEKEYTIVHSLDGYDEVSLTGDVKMISRQEEKISSPEELGFERVKQKDLHGGKTVEEAVSIFMSVLNGAGTPQQNMAVLVNSALAIRCAKPGTSMQDAIAAAKESLESKKALNTLRKLIALNG